jgi:hypothetical protein
MSCAYIYSVPQNTVFSNSLTTSLLTLPMDILTRETYLDHKDVILH